MRMGSATISTQGHMPRPSDMLRCERCGQSGQPVQFHDASICRSCHHAPSDAHVTRNRSAARQAARDLLKAKVGIVTAPTSMDLAASIVDKFGTIDDFTREWYTNIQAAQMACPGSFAALRAFEQVTRLIVASTPKTEEKKVIASELSDDEIEQELIGIIMDGINSGRIDPNGLTEWTGNTGQVEPVHSVNPESHELQIELLDPE